MNTQELPKIETTKPAWKSLTILGTLLSIGSAFLPAIAPISESWNEIGVVIGGALTIFGRLRADKRITGLLK